MFMKERFEQFFKRHAILAIFSFFFIILALVFLMPKIYSSFDETSKKIYWGTLFFSFGISVLIFFGQKSKKKEIPVKDKVISSTTRSYQQLLDEIERCSKKLRERLLWAYSYLVMGWIALLLGKWSEQPPYNHPIFAIPVFILALLGATRSLEEENELDTSIVNCTVEGLEMEIKRPELESTYFHDLRKSYEGSGMWQLAFIRISPFLMIIFSLLNSGLLAFFADYFSIPEWLANGSSGVVLGSVCLFFTKMICRPYYWLLEKTKTISV